MAVRVKTFAVETAERLGSLHTEFDFLGPVPVPGVNGSYALCAACALSALIWPSRSAWCSRIWARCMSPPFSSLRMSLDLSARTKIGRDTAHTGYQQRRALDLQGPEPAESARRPRAGHPELGPPRGYLCLP